jgi:hypothetical protein
VILTTLFVLALGAFPVAAAEPLTIVDDTVIKAEPGSSTNLATVAVEPDRIGTVCTLLVHSQNQSSVHSGNDLVVTTGDMVAVIDDVEAEADEGRDLSTEVVLGPTISVDLRMGDDRRSSLGFSLELDCGTTAPVLVQGASVTTVPESPVEVTTTVPPPPDPCSTADDGSLTVDQDTCPSTTSTPATAPTTTSVEAEVLGVQVARLPQTPAGVAVVAAPAYTG